MFALAQVSGHSVPKQPEDQEAAVQSTLRNDLAASKQLESNLVGGPEMQLPRQVAAAR